MIANIYIIFTLLAGLYLVGVYLAYGTLQAVQLNLIQTHGNVTPAHPRMLLASWYAVYWNHRILKVQKKKMAGSKYIYNGWYTTWRSLLWTGDMVNEINIKQLSDKGASEIMSGMTDEVVAELQANIRKAFGEDTEVVFGTVHNDGTVEMHSDPQDEVEAVKDILRGVFGEDVEITHVKDGFEGKPDSAEETDTPRKWGDYEA